MKIAFDHQIFTMESYGGISRYYTRLSKELLELEQDVSIFTGIHRNKYLSFLPSSAIKGIKLNKYPPKTGRLFLAANHYWANWRSDRWKPDVIHETYYSLMTKTKKVTPTVVTVYDMVHELFSDKFSKTDPTTQLKKKAISRADHIISISHSTKNDLIELFGVKPEKISVVHLASDMLSSNFLSSSLEELTETKPFLLYVGGRGGYKNFLGFLQSVASSPKLSNEFDIIAFGGGKFNNDELSMIKSLKFKKNQVRQQSGSDQILSELYSKASAFVYPSLYEGFGLPPLEAMFYECPVISSNTSSMPEVIGNAAEFFDPHSIEAISIAIENVVFSLPRIKELRTNGLARVREFSWRKCAEETLGAYMELAG